LDEGFSAVPDVEDGAHRGGTGKHLSTAREWAIPLGDAS
jgi:hypothetical protein